MLTNDTFLKDIEEHFDSLITLQKLTTTNNKIVINKYKEKSNQLKIIIHTVNQVLFGYGMREDSIDKLLELQANDEDMTIHYDINYPIIHSLEKYKTGVKYLMTSGLEEFGEFFNDLKQKIINIDTEIDKFYA